MSDTLYHEQIVALAKARTGAGKLVAPTGSARRDNPLCGDRVTMDVRTDEAGRILELAHQVRGCLLCQASASALASVAAGHDIAGVAALRRSLHKIIGRADSGSAEDTPAFAAFAPVASHKARHECVGLPFDALEAALKKE